jgi:aldose 1-epimerase
MAKAKELGRLALFALTLVACMPDHPAPRRMPSIGRQPYGVLPSGDSVALFSLDNGRGVTVKAIEYGAIITAIVVPDREGRVADIVLGHDSLAGYLAASPYFGAVVGRFGNRIAKGRFELDGVTYHLATNNGPNHLHGGIRGFDKVRWTGTAVEADSIVGVRFAYRSPDGEEGYPGTVTVSVTYALNLAGELIVDYAATSDKATPVNLTQHSYFNLTGLPSRDVLGHFLTIPADRYTPVDSTLIPTGALDSVGGSPFDFRAATAVGARIGAEHQQLRFGKGYDHNFVLNRSGEGLALAATLTDPSTGRSLTVRTTEPGLQFYSGNFLDGSITGKGGQVYRHRSGLTLETQHFPDSPNRPQFPSTILRPGTEYRSETVFAFGVAR